MIKIALFLSFFFGKFLCNALLKVWNWFLSTVSSNKATCSFIYCMLLLEQNQESIVWLNPWKSLPEHSFNTSPCELAHLIIGKPQYTQCTWSRLKLKHLKLCVMVFLNLSKYHTKIEENWNCYKFWKQYKKILGFFCLELLIFL